MFLYQIFAKMTLKYFFEASNSVKNIIRKIAVSQNNVKVPVVDMLRHISAILKQRLEIVYTYSSANAI